MKQTSCCHQEILDAAATLFKSSSGCNCAEANTCAAGVPRPLPLWESQQGQRLTPAGHRHHMVAAGCSQGERGPFERTCSRGETIHAARRKKNPGQHLHPLEISGAFSEMKLPVDVKAWFHPFRSKKFRRENKGFA